MSVVTCKVYKNRITFAADSMITEGYSTQRSSKEFKNFSKLFEINDMIIGCAGNCDELSLLSHFANTHKPLAATEKDILDFIVEFSDYKNKLTGNYIINNSYLIGYKGKVFEVEGMLVWEVVEHSAIGCGYTYALAALHLGHTAKEATKVACDLNAFVAEPIIELEMKR